MTPDEFKAAREFLCMSQAELAAAYGYSGASKISNYETGSRTVPRLLGELLDRDVKIRTLHQAIDNLIARSYGRLSAGAVDKLEDMRAICIGIPNNEKDGEDPEPIFARIEHPVANIESAIVHSDGWSGFVCSEGTEHVSRFFYIRDGATGNLYRYLTGCKRVGPAHVILKEAIELKKGGAE